MRNEKGQFIRGHPAHPNWIKVWTKTKEERTCAICKIKFVVLASSPKQHCSKVCGDKTAAIKRSGPNNWLWKGGTTNATRAFYQRRREAKKRANGGTHNYSDWLLLKILFQFRCPACLRPE